LGIGTFSLIAFQVRPHLEPSWSQQIQIALNAAHAVDDQASFFQIHEHVPDDFQENPDQSLEPLFLFSSPSGTGFTLRLTRAGPFVFADVHDIGRQGTPITDVQVLGSEWFHDTATQIHTSPTEAIFTAHAALRDEYKDEAHDFPDFFVLTVGSQTEDDYGTRAVWHIAEEVVLSPEVRRMRIVIINAQTGEVLEITDRYCDISFFIPGIVGIVLTCAQKRISHHENICFDTKCRT
jgi:hypothetical protein